MFADFDSRGLCGRTELNNQVEIAAICVCKLGERVFERIAHTAFELVPQDGSAQAAVDRQAQAWVGERISLKKDDEGVGGFAELVEVDRVVLAFVGEAHGPGEGAFSGGGEVCAAGKHGRD